MPTDTAAPENVTEVTEETEVEATEATTEAPEADEPVEGEEALGDPGKKALDKMKADLKAAKAEAREAKKALEDAAASTEEEKKAREVERNAVAKANERILKAEIRAAAAGKLNDPTDALRYLDLTEFEVGDDGEVDTDAITDAIASLTDAKPYLAVQDGRRFTGSADTGTRKETGPRQLTQTDVDALKAAGNYQGIEDAREKGLLNDLLGIK